jgi:ribose transport system substrate-binding protein
MSPTADGFNGLDRRALLRFLAGSGAVLSGAITPGAASRVAAQSTPEAGGPAADGATAESLADFGPFVPGESAGPAPDLPKRMAFTVPTQNEYFLQISDGIQMAADERGLEYQLLSSEGDPVKNIDIINSLLQRGVGGLFIQPEDAQAQGQVLQQAIDQGVCVVFLVTPPCTSQIVADQYDLGYQQAIATVKWIEENMGGEAKVVNFILDHIEALIPRHQGTLDGLATGGPGIEVIVEQELQRISQEEGFEFASTILQAQPDANVWLGPDDTVLGVNSYLSSVGRNPAEEAVYLSGLAGTVAGKDAVSEGNTFIRSVWGFNDPLNGYAVGQFVADWLEGKEIPQVIQVKAAEMTTAEQVEAWDAALADPSAAFQLALEGEEPSTSFLGSISYATKDNYLRNIIGGSDG